MAASLQRPRGFLRIYLGAAAGVGKTYQMLGDARLAAEEGTDIVIGYLEPHGRVATEERARGLEHAPVVHYGSGSRAETEPDVDWLIERRPSVAIVDELAHTNPPGAPRPKRYDDVDTLLAHGIDVWTTVNIQHLESLGSRIRSLTGVEVRETFPDRLLHEADEIKLVDLSPASLRERIARGLVYGPDRVEQALNGFFTVSNLTALRALVLHELAEVAAAQLDSSAPGLRPSERVLVATGGRRDSYAQLIRTGARLARRSDSELYVLARRAPGRPDRRRHCARAGRCRGADALARRRLPAPPRGEPGRRDHPRGRGPAHHADRGRQEQALGPARAPRRLARRGRAARDVGHRRARRRRSGAATGPGGQ